MVRGMWIQLSLGRLAFCAACLGLLMGLAGCASGPAVNAVGGRVKAVSRQDPASAKQDVAQVPDAVPQIEPIKPGGPNKPYAVLGQSYVPLVQDVPMKERGVASWYGPGFHGRRTASGELFSMYGMTAAHRTLPIPSYVRVRNVSNGKEVIVRVNDRGPFHSARVLDLSYAAASRLGVTASGSATVEIERLTFDQIRTGAWRQGASGDVGLGVDMASKASPQPGAATQASPAPGASVLDAPLLTASAAATVGQEARSGATPASPAAPDVEATFELASAPIAVARAYTAPAQGFWVQLAALSRRDGIDRLQQRVASELASLTPLLAVFQEAPLFKLQVGPFASKDDALAAARQLRQSLQLSPMILQRR